MSSLQENVVIVGGGVAGLATSLALHKIGVSSLVLEQADHLRITGAAFAMWSNAWTALETLGIAENIRGLFYDLEGVKVSSICSNARNQVSVKECGVEIRCVERKVLLEALANALPPDSIRFNSKAVSLMEVPNSSPTLMEVKLSDGTSITAKIVIGCDGVHSIVSKTMGMGESFATGRSAFRGMSLLPSEKIDNNPQKWGIQMNGKGVRTGQIPCRDNKVFWFITRKSLPSDASTWIDPESMRQAALESAKDFPEEFAELIKLTDGHTLTLGELRMKWVWPWKWDEVYGGKGCVVLVGDAFHSMWPDLAQGACLALEDAVVLARNLFDAGIHDDNWNKDKMSKVEVSLKKYRDERKWRVCAVAGTAYIAGNLLSGFSAGFRFLRDMVVLRLANMRFMTNFAKYNCGDLPRLT